MFQPPYMKFNHKPYGMVTEGVFHTRHLNKLRFRFISMLSDVEDSREDAFEQIKGNLNPNQFDYLRNIDFYAAQHISKSLHLQSWQIQIIEKEKGIGWITFIIPKLKENYNIVKKLLEYYGYFVSTKMDYKLNGLDYMIIEFQPNTQMQLNEVLKRYNYVYHVCPSKYDNRIMKNGLVPKDRKEPAFEDDSLFSYSGRLFVFLNVDSSDNELPETEDRLIIMFANKLYGEKPKTDSKYFNDREYSIWKINLQEALKSINFYFDYTEQDFLPSLYTTENISPKWMSKIKQIIITRR